VPQYPRYRIAIGVSCYGKLIDLGVSRDDMIGDPQSSHDMHTPRCAEIA
jgi:hypothetical protein